MHRECLLRAKFAAFLVSAAAAVSSNIGCGMNHNHYPYAIYRDFVVLGGGGGELTAGLRAPIPSTIYIQVSDGSKFALKDLPENVVAKELEKSGSRDIKAGDATYLRSRTMLEFTQGRLTYANLDYSWEGLKIGSSPKGPSYKFPLTPEQIVELFGEPLEWRRRPKEPSGP